MRRYLCQNPTSTQFVSILGVCFSSGLLEYPPCFFLPANTNELWAFSEQTKNAVYIWKPATSWGGQGIEMTRNLHERHVPTVPLNTEFHSYARETISGCEHASISETKTNCFSLRGF